MNSNQIPVAAPVTTDSAGTNSSTALSAVMRVICPTTDSTGTGFLHASGWIITAEHVVRGASPNSVKLLTAAGAQVAVGDIRMDKVLDLAVIKPTTALAVAPLSLSTSNNFAVGTQVSTYGFPFGYTGLPPMLTVGYLSAVENINGVARWVINAAFNSGNSGGPVLRLEDGAVMGVVASKLAPLPPAIKSILEALSNQKSGFQYPVTYPDGRRENFSEGQLVGAVLEFLRSQTQLVVGHAVMLNNLRDFLTCQGITP